MRVGRAFGHVFTRLSRALKRRTRGCQCVWDVPSDMSSLGSAARCSNKHHRPSTLEPQRTLTLDPQAFGPSSRQRQCRTLTLSTTNPIGSRHPTLLPHSESQAVNPALRAEGGDHWRWVDCYDSYLFVILHGFVLTLILFILKKPE